MLKEHSISNSSGDIVCKELADVVVSGLKAFEDGCELLSDDVSDKDEELSVPLVLVLSALELPDGDLGKDTEDSRWSQTQAVNWQYESHWMMVVAL